jgi:hypothetical protein
MAATVDLPPRSENPWALTSKDAKTLPPRIDGRGTDGSVFVSNDRIAES